MASFKRITAVIVASPACPAIAPPRKTYIVELSRGLLFEKIESHFRWLSLRRANGVTISDKITVGDYSAYFGDLDSDTTESLKRDPNVS